jgi:hypothetical protein
MNAALDTREAAKLGGTPPPGASSTSEAPSPGKKPRKKSKTSPTQRTLKYLREQGCQLVAVTERWNPHARIRQDLFGIIDVLALKDDQVIAVQATAGGVSARINKIAEADSTNPITGGN